MKKFYEIGSVVFDYMVLTIILIISGFLILPFYTVYVGIIGFYHHDETYKSLLITVKENYKNLMVLTFVLIVFVGLMIGVNLYFNQYVIISMIVYGISGYFSLLILTYAPIIMIKMHVSFKELIRNMFLLSIVKFQYTLVLFGMVILMVYLFSLDLVWMVLLIVMLIRTIYFISHKALMSSVI